MILSNVYLNQYVVNILLKFIGIDTRNWCWWYWNGNYIGEIYKILSESFEIDYPSSLRYLLQIHLFAMLLDSWSSVYGLVDVFYPLFWIIFAAVSTIFTVLIYSFPASNLIKGDYIRDDTV